MLIKQLYYRKYSLSLQDLPKHHFVSHLSTKGTQTNAPYHISKLLITKHTSHSTFLGLFLLEVFDFSLKGLNQVVGLFLPALGAFLLCCKEASQISSGASAAFLQLPHPCVQSLLLQAVLLLHLCNLGQQNENMGAKRSPC